MVDKLEPCGQVVDVIFGSSHLCIVVSCREGETAYFCWGQLRAWWSARLHTRHMCCFWHCCSEQLSYHNHSSQTWLRRIVDAAWVLGAFVLGNGLEVSDNKFGGVAVLARRSGVRERLESNFGMNGKV